MCDQVFLCWFVVIGCDDEDGICFSFFGMVCKIDCFNCVVGVGICNDWYVFGGNFDVEFDDVFVFGV